MTQPKPQEFNQVPTLEEVMVSLAKQSIFDLPTLARELVDAAQKKAEAENDPGITAVLVGSWYVLGVSTAETVQE